MEEVKVKVKLKYNDLAPGRKFRRRNDPVSKKEKEEVITLVKPNTVVCSQVFHEVFVHSETCVNIV